MTQDALTRGDEAGVLTELGLYEPNEKRSAQLRARCHAALERRRRHEVFRGEPGWRLAVGLALGPAVVGTLGAVYLFQVISRAMQLYRF